MYKENKFEGALFCMLYKQPFLGNLVQKFIRIYSLEGAQRYKIPTAAVAVQDCRYMLIINPSFFDELDLKGRIAILIHEMYHVLNEHLTRAHGRDPRIHNVSCDLSINQVIPNLPTRSAEKIEEMVEKSLENYKGNKKAAKKKMYEDLKSGKRSDGSYDIGLQPEHYGMPKDGTSEFYYDLIMKDDNLKQKFQKQKIKLVLGGKGGGEPLSDEDIERIKNGEVDLEISLDSHEQWKTMDEATKEIMDADLKRIIREALEEAKRSGRNYGDLPGNIQQAIDAILGSKVNWKHVLRSFVQVATQAFRVESKKRPSRRFGYGFLGRKSEYKINLAVIVDSSGSISDEELGLFATEINRIHDSKQAKITIIVGDADVTDVFEYKRKMSQIVFKGRGGTDAKPWIRKAEELKVDAAIILTDGEFAYNFKRPRMPILWCLVPSSYREHCDQLPFGKKIYLELEDK